MAREGRRVEGLLLRARTGRLTAPWPRAEALTTQRLVLEPLRPEHARELAPVLDDPALHAFTGGQPASEAELFARYVRQAEGRSPDGTQGWLNWVRPRPRDARAGGHRAGDDVRRRGRRSAELAWVIATSRQGEGLATEAAGAVVAWLRDQGVTRFVAHIHPDHRVGRGRAAPGARRHGCAPPGEVRWVGS